jgi:uncharacterized membrane protein (DUF4010 family)
MVDPVTDPLLVVGFHLAVAFGIGALIGMEREQSKSAGVYAGSRTFPLIALYGALVQAFFPALLPIALAAIALPLTTAYLAKIWTEQDLGLTTLTAALLTVILGAMTVHSDRGLELAVIIGGLATVVLSAKGIIHGFAAQIGEEERRASLKFILVVLVVYPLLPDRELDQLLGLNPRFIWLMVVFVTGLSFVAYLLSKILGTTRGIAITGILGGFVSSTATTVSMAYQASEEPSLYRICAFSTVIASVVMFPRALVEVAVVNRSLLPYVVLPLGAMTLLGGVAAGLVYWQASGRANLETDIQNPFRLRTALVFGAIFAAVLLVSEYANEWLDTSGVYTTAFVSGLADVDAITLSLSKLAADGAISPTVAATGIVIGAIANTLVKAGLAWVLGTRKLGLLVSAVLGAAAVVGLGVMLLL